MREPTTRCFRRRNLCCRSGCCRKRWDKNPAGISLARSAVHRGCASDGPWSAESTPPHRQGLGIFVSARAETQGVPWRRVRHKCAEPRELAVARAPPSRRSVWNRTPPSPLRRHHPPMRCLSGLASVVTQNSLRVLHVDSCQPRPQVSLAPTAPRPSAALGAAQPSWMPPEERQLLWLPTGEHGPQP